MSERIETLIGVEESSVLSQNIHIEIAKMVKSSGFTATEGIISAIYEFVEQKEKQAVLDVVERIENLIKDIKKRHGNNEVKTFIFFEELNKIRSETGE